MHRLIDFLSIAYIKLSAMLLKNHYYSLRLRWGAEMADLPQGTSKHSHALGHRAQRTAILAEKEFTQAKNATTRKVAGEHFIAGKRYAREAKAFMRVAYDTNEYPQIMELMQASSAHHLSDSEQQTR